MANTTAGDVQQALPQPLTERELEILSYVAEGLSDREVAQKLYLSIHTVKWHNKQIYSKMGVRSRTQAIARAIEYGLLDTEGQRGSPIKGRAQPKHNLPGQVTSFVGRERRISEIKRLLLRTRLLTLTGPPGTGKTRLALRVAGDLLDDFEHGVYFVDLAAINRPELLPASIARALDIQETPEQSIILKLKGYLSDKNLLLLLDNFEHVVEAAPLVSNLLSSSPQLKVVATSRESLLVYGEQEYPVPPLILPDMNRPRALPLLLQSEAVALFMQRAQAVKPDFTLNDADALSVAEICVRLDGLPLAIELAAARMKLFSPKALLLQLKNRLTALQVGPRNLPRRQRTLRGAIAWSFELLDDEEKTLFARLSVFQRGQTAESAEGVCVPDLSIDLLNGLESLLNKSLLHQGQGPDGETRFSMLETIREYAREQLEAMGQTEELRRRHAKYFTTLAERAESHLRAGPKQMRWLARLEAEHDNLHSALEWSLGGADMELGLRMVAALGHFWFRQGHYAEGRRWTARALEASNAAPPALRAALLNAAGLVAFYSHDHATAKRMHQQSLTLYRELNDKRKTGWSMIWLGVQSFKQPDEYEEALELLDDALLLLREAGDRAGVCQALNALGEITRRHGDYDRARKAYNEGLAVARDIGDKLREAWLLFDLGMLALHETDPESADLLFHESLALALEVEHKPQIIHILAALAGLAALQGLPERGAQLLGAAEALFDVYKFGPQPSVLPDIEHTKATLRRKLESATFDAAMAQGKVMDLADAVAFALDEPVLGK